ncbi:hypothetical protein [Actinomadura sp. 9N215]|uniref:hypothetical protein n=1 Tax=Actinomadura sp. 9N215 TaxID=3375150 RepID=UPI00379CC97A
MSSTLFKSASSWTAACPGASIPGVPAAYAETSGPRPRDPRGMRGLNLRDLRVNLRDLRVDQRIQDQGRTVFDHLLEGMNVQAPATAHVGVTVKGDVSGPYPWRPPV